MSVADLAKSCGAELQPRLPNGEVVAFRLRPDGGLSATLASGESLHACAPSELEPSERPVVEKTLSVLRQLVPGGQVKPGVTYFRRRAEMAEDMFGTIFTEVVDDDCSKRRWEVDPGMAHKGKHQDLRAYS